MQAKIRLTKGDITLQKVDAIVNAANNSLLGGGGVDGAIHRAGGPKILEECKIIRSKQGGCKTGEAVITSGGNLPARFVIHTVGPVWRGGRDDEDILLTNAYLNSLKLAADNGLRTVAFPNISTGIYGFPRDRAAEIAINTTREFIMEQQSLEEIIFVCYDEENYSIYKKILNN